MKKSLCAGLAALGWLALGGIRWRQSRAFTRRSRFRPGQPAGMARVEGAAHRCMMTTIVPASRSRLYLMRLAEEGPVVLTPVLVEVNSGLLAPTHAATWNIDSTSQRPISPDEQHIDVHWKQFRALLGCGDGRPRFGLKWKHPNDIAPHVKE